jgi:hypothetical protein
MPKLLLILYFIIIILNLKCYQLNNQFLPVSKLTNSSTNQFKSNNIKVNSIIEKSVTLTCTINLDNITFFKANNYKIIWSRESDNGKDYEPLFLDDSRLIFDQRIIANRFTINKKSYDQLQWNLVINDLKLTDSNNYICQLNQPPYDQYWLRRFILNVFGIYIYMKL